MFGGFPKLPSGWIIDSKDSQNSRKAVMLVVTVHYGERTQSKINQRKRPLGQSSGRGVGEGPNAGLPGVLSPWNRGWCYLLLATVYGSAHAVLPSGETPEPWGLAFLVALSHIAPTWLILYPQPLLEA